MNIFQWEAKNLRPFSVFQSSRPFLPYCQHRKGNLCSECSANEGERERERESVSGVLSLKHMHY